MNMKQIIAVDFDGTIVEHDFPGIGKPIRYAVEILKGWQQKGNLVTLWTCRGGYELAEALTWCSKEGLRFDTVNSTAYGAVGYGVPKIVATYYIDDRSIEYRMRTNNGNLTPEIWLEIATFLEVDIG